MVLGMFTPADGVSCHWYDNLAASEFLSRHDDTFALTEMLVIVLSSYSCNYYKVFT